MNIDTLTNEVAQCFMQPDGWESCRYLLGKYFKEQEELIQKLQEECCELDHELRSRDYEELENWYHGT